MGWEEVPCTHGNSMFTQMSDKEVSLVYVKTKKGPNLRMNIVRASLPEKTVALAVKIDREKKRVGFFKPKDEVDGRRVIAYNKKRNSRMVYCSLPKVVKELGFDRGRYEIVKKDGIEGLVFMIYVDRKSKVEESAS